MKAGDSETPLKYFKKYFQETQYNDSVKFTKMCAHEKRGPGSALCGSRHQKILWV